LLAALLYVQDFYTAHLTLLIAAAFAVPFAFDGNRWLLVAAAVRNIWDRPLSWR
jgi:hypothetical protein